MRSVNRKLCLGFSHGAITFDSSVIALFRSAKLFYLAVIITKSMVEAAGVEPASENIPLKPLHTYPGF